MTPYRISATDRALFKRCRRAWDFGASARGNREPATGAPARAGLAEGLRASLAVYYFPGMWSWNRDIVQPLVHQAVDRAGLTGAEAALAHRMLDRYAPWASALDDFVPVQVSTDIDVTVPDPVLSDQDLATATGQPVHLSARIDALVFGNDDRPWLLCHRLRAGPFGEARLLALDEEALTGLWAWSQFALDSRMAGVIFNEISLGDAGGGEEAFRRTVVPVPPAELARLGRQLGYEVLDMLDPALVLYPNPTEDNCPPCPFVGPCLAVQQGLDPEELLSNAYRLRSEPPLEEGRLGGRTWSMSRGARPPRFDRDT